MYRSHASFRVVQVGHAIIPGVHVPAIKVGKAKSVGKVRMKRTPIADLGTINLDVLGHLRLSGRTTELSDSRRVGLPTATAAPGKAKALELLGGAAVRSSDLVRPRHVIAPNKHSNEEIENAAAIKLKKMVRTKNSFLESPVAGKTPRN